MILPHGSDQCRVKVDTTSDSSSSTRGSTGLRSRRVLGQVACAPGISYAGRLSRSQHAFIVYKSADWFSCLLFCTDLLLGSNPDVGKSISLMLGIRRAVARTAPSLDEPYDSPRILPLCPDVTCAVDRSLHRPCSQIIAGHCELHTSFPSPGIVRLLADAPPNSASVRVVRRGRASRRRTRRSGSPGLPTPSARTFRCLPSRQVPVWDDALPPLDFRGRGDSQYMPDYFVCLGKDNPLGAKQRPR